MGGDVRSDRWRCGGRACPCAQTDRPGGAEAAADRAPGQHQLGALPARDDAAGLGRREPGARDRGGPSPLPDRVFAFDEFGPLGIRPTAGSGWAARQHPDRLPASYHRTHGVRYFHGCYSVGDDRLWGVNHRRKGAVNTLAVPTAPRSTSSWTTCPPTRAATSDAGRRNTRSSCVSPRPTPRGRTLSRPTSGRCGSSPSPTRTTPITRFRPGPCTPTCAGAMPTPAVAMSWPPNARNARVRSEKGIRWGGRPLATAA